MKNIYTCLSVLVFPMWIAAQQQITNFGNLKFHQAASVGVYGNFQNDGTLMDTANVVWFKGNTVQLISGSAPIRFNNLIVENASGVSLQDSIVIKNSVGLTTGPLFLNSNMLTVLNANGTSVTRTTGVVVSEQTNNSGRFSWNIGNNTGAHIFPFGTSLGQYIPFTLDLTAGDMGMVTLATYPTISTNLPYPSNPDLVTHVNNALGADNSANTVDRFWQIEKSGASGTATITFTATTSEVGSISNLSAYRWNSSSQGWETPGGTQTSSSTSVTVQDVVNFSPWTLAGNSSPLPVELLNFTATLNDQRKVDLVWTTASEINNDYFTIEKTVDGVHYEFVAIVEGAGNSNTVLNYSTIDPTPYSGHSYYRLKQTDFDGTDKYADLRSIFIGQTANISMQVFPNPAHGECSVVIAGLSNQEAQISLTDISGKICYTQRLMIESDNYTIQMKELANLSAGIYSVQLLTGTKLLTSKLVLN